MSAARRARVRRDQPSLDAAFPVTPMLDMAFQVLAFFILIYQPVSDESRIDLVLPAEAAALPVAARSPGQGEGAGILAPDAEPATPPGDLAIDIEVRAEADAAGSLAALRLGGARLPGPVALEARLRRYRRLLPGRPLRLRLVADDQLRYEVAARLIAAARNAGVATVRLAGPPVAAGGATP